MNNTTTTQISNTSSGNFKCTMPAKLENLETLQTFITEHDQIPEHLKNSLCLAAEEIFVNICSYAYEEENGNIDFSMKISDRIVLTFCDSGKKFNPLEQVTDIENYDIGQQIGGLGLFLAFEIADHVEYQYTDHKNVLTLTKKL